MKEPKVSILMPVYKGDKYLQDAVDSVLNQTFKDFEFIIICDDPIDETRFLFDRYQQKDSRIRVFYQKKQGLVKSLNTGISLAKGEYIARMDADDISLPDRLRKQVEFMDNNPEVGICGTWVETIGDVLGNVWKHPCDHETIKSRMLFETVIAHPSIIVRKGIFLKNKFAYMQDEVYAEDYGLWVRAAKIVKLANIPEILIHYRIHKSTSNRREQRLTANKIRLAQIKDLGIKTTKEEFEIHEALSYYEIKPEKKFLLQVRFWLEKLKIANSKMRVYPESAFSTVLGQYWYYACRTSTYLGMDSWNIFNESKLSKSISLSPVQKIRFILRSKLNTLRCRK